MLLQLYCNIYRDSEAEFSTFFFTTVTIFFTTSTTSSFNCSSAKCEVKWQVMYYLSKQINNIFPHKLQIKL